MKEHLTFDNATIQVLEQAIKRLTTMQEPMHADEAFVFCAALIVAGKSAQRHIKDADRDAANRARAYEATLPWPEVKKLYGIAGDEMKRRGE